MKAQIIKIVSKEYTLYTEEKEIVKAVLTGKIRKQVTPVVGDYVQAEKLHEQWTVQKILERSSYMQRPAIANVNQALIIMSCKDPDFSSALVDRISILVKKAGITPILVVTKCDMGMEGYIQESVEEYQNGPMRVILTGKDRNCEELEEVFQSTWKREAYYQTYRITFRMWWTGGRYTGILVIGFFKYFETGTWTVYGRF